MKTIISIATIIIAASFMPQAEAYTAYRTTCQNGFGQIASFPGYGCPAGWWAV